MATLLLNNGFKSLGVILHGYIYLQQNDDILTYRLLIVF